MSRKDDKEAQKEFWPDFIVRCRSCKSFKIHLENTLGYSPESGGWGSVEFVCQDCGTRSTIMDS
jgi:hypothetical protein